jgi:ribonuclease HII
MPNPRWTHDRKLIQGQKGVIGVDEAGRGCLAGPVVAGCVIIPYPFFRSSANRRKTHDSKQFSESQRETLFGVIENLAKEGEIFSGTGHASIEEIEEFNIVGATCLAMRRAMEEAALKSKKLWQPELKRANDLFRERKDLGSNWQVLVDGREMKRLPYAHHGVVKGDTLSLSIAMASLIAKVTRDRWMRELDSEYPQYDFKSNKGYGAPLHLKALREYGPTICHRPRFLRNLLEQNSAEEKTSDDQCLLSFG